MDIELVSLSRTHTTIMDQSQNTTSLNIQMNSQPNFLQLIIVFAAKNPRSFVRVLPARPLSLRAIRILTCPSFLVLQAGLAGSALGSCGTNSSPKAFVNIDCLRLSISCIDSSRCFESCEEP